MHIYGIQAGYRGFYSSDAGPPLYLNPKMVHGWHKTGGTLSNLIDDYNVGFQTAVEMAQQAINAAHVEAESAVTVAHSPSSNIEQPRCG
ncbi:hypothetical protein Ddye_014589 [Dipteronia dyeriana]|uniref:Uncharacterized protein n=1 Tax=Dipteronia dyeriana TaxID=168575 RepID=A0AAE0CLA6_9ROSI|nr:hypothetical protein Ddye_014589 [Dipteronia dyeriana]